jgi:hypothetical protein
MDTKKEAKKYLNKYFKAQYIEETDDEFKGLVKILNKALRIHDVVERSEQLLEAQSNWLMANTSLEVEKIVDFKEHFK